MSKQYYSITGISWLHKIIPLLSSYYPPIIPLLAVALPVLSGYTSSINKLYSSVYVHKFCESKGGAYMRIVKLLPYKRDKCEDTLKRFDAYIITQVHLFRNCS